MLIVAALGRLGELQWRLRLAYITSPIASCEGERKRLIDGGG